MRKNTAWLGALLCALTLVFTGCGAETTSDIPAEAVSLNVGFINETGADVGFLRIRPTAEDEWSENLLQEEIWKQNYEVPVSLSGILPEVTEGWQVQMTFLDATEAVWEGVGLTDGTTITFTYETGVTGVTVANREAA